MQTFLPYPDFAQSAWCLDRQRLGKQRVEVLQLLRALLVPGSGWANHPATRMWRSYEDALAAYGVEICREWTRRGYRDTCRIKILSIDAFTPTPVLPPWLGDPAFHASHRAALLFKSPKWYSQFGWDEIPKIEYLWPVGADLAKSDGRR